MTTRTFRQLGIAYGPAPVTITAKVNNSVVFQGPVTTLDEALPILPDQDFDISNVLFSWPEEVTFVGPRVIEITVDSEDAEVIVAGVDANYTIPPRPPELPEGRPVPSGGPNEYTNILPEKVGDVLHNGVIKQKVTTADELDGQWWWVINGTDVLVKNITVDSGGE